MTATPLHRVTADGVDIAIHGECAAGFERVLDAFASNFSQRRELGASFCVYQGGRKVVDLWAGHRDPARATEWTGDTLVGMASVIKGMLALGLHLLAERGRISYDAPVAQYWPEFAQNGKERITVRQAISHHAALQFADAAQPGDLFRYQPFVDAVAAQKPEWEPGTRGVYHTLTIIPIMAELIRQVSGAMASDFFRREVTEKLGVDYHIRMQPAELARFAQDCETEGFMGGLKVPPEVMARFFKPVGDPTQLSPELMMNAPYLAGGTARGVARLFAFVAMNGALDGQRIFSPRTLDLMSEPQWDEPCAVWGTPMKTALGLLVNNSFFYIGPNPRAFGTAGGGGSFGMADRDIGLSAGYSLNRWWPALALGDRARSLIDATYASL
jgi:CubicO group peptidase (beta-lactamase class C family)